jgi:DNA-binding protein H-NS
MFDLKRKKRKMPMSSSKPTISDLQEQMKAIQAEIESRRVSARSELRADIEDMLKDEEMTLAEVFPEFVKSSKATAGKTRNRTDVAAKYQDPVSGDLWSGRGRSPRWVVSILDERGITIKDFKQMSEFAA